MFHRRMLGQRRARVVLATRFAHLLQWSAQARHPPATANQMLFPIASSARRISGQFAGSCDNAAALLCRRRCSSPSAPPHLHSYNQFYPARVFAGVIHGGRIRQRRRVESSALIQTEAVARLSHARFTISSSCVPGCAEIKIRIRYRSFPARLYKGQITLKRPAAPYPASSFRQRTFFSMLRRNLQMPPT